MALKGISLLVLMVLFGSNCVRAEEIFFLPERFFYITLSTTKGKERVVFESFDKMTDVTQTTLRSRLIRVRENVYRTPRGTVFTLEHLPAPIINDANRHINSGDWRLTVTGSGKEYRHLDSEIPNITDSKSPRLVFLGSVGADPR